MPKQAESLPDSPDELLRFCDGELQRLRAQRAHARPRRGAVLAVSLLVLFMGAMAAFIFLFAQLQGVAKPESAPPSGSMQSPAP
jgi:hypothetical protein